MTSQRDGGSAAADEQLSIVLEDGRRLAFAEYGDPAGDPIFFFHGTPGSRRFRVPAWSNPGVGARFIVPDRPGLGRSDRQPGRNLLAWADDVGRLADELGIARFAVAGLSGGGPHALACAYRLPDRITSCGLISSGGPLDAPGAFAQLPRRTQRMMAMATHHPRRLRRVFGGIAAVMRLRGLLPGRLGLIPTRAFPTAADRSVLRDLAVRTVLTEESREATRGGVQGVVDELVMLAQPWSFDPADIAVPISCWHGALDELGPVAIVRELAGRTGAGLTVYEDEGHLLVFRYWEDIAAGLFEAAR